MTSLLMATDILKPVNFTIESYCICFFFFGCVDGVKRVYARMVAIFFVTLNFNPSLISRLITDSDLDRVKLIFGNTLMDD